MKAIVTGGAGFIGSHIAERLLDDGHQVTIVDDLSAGKEENIPEMARFVKASVTQKLPDELFQWADVIFHNAASKKNVCLKNPLRDLEVNGGGTLRLLESARRFGVKKFVHASTGSVYGNVVDSQISEGTHLLPVSYYGISKLTGENYVRFYGIAYDMNVTVLRYFHVYGERQENDPALGGVVAIFLDRVKNGRSIVIHGSGEQERVFTHVDDIVEANMQAWKQPRAYGQVYNCAASEKITVLKLAEMIMEKYGEVDLAFESELPGDIFWFDVSSLKIEQALGVPFRKFTKGFKEVTR